MEIRGRKAPITIPKELGLLALGINFVLAPFLVEKSQAGQ